MKFKNFIDLFYSGNTIIYGLRGRGKDLLTGNVVARCEESYASNIDYTQDNRYIPLDIKDININNTFLDFLNGTLTPYEYPYGDNVDVFISDAGIYFPSQHYLFLNKYFDGVTCFNALSRHLGNCNVHLNTQALNRLWDKFREQCDIYINCRWCKVFFGLFVVQKIRIYEREDSAVNCIQPFKPCYVSLFPTREERKANALARVQYLNTHGSINEHVLFYLNKAKYDSRLFKTLLTKKGDN